MSVARRDPSEDHDEHPPRDSAVFPIKLVRTPDGRAGLPILWDEAEDDFPTIRYVPKTAAR